MNTAFDPEFVRNVENDRRRKETDVQAPRNLWIGYGICLLVMALPCVVFIPYLGIAIYRKPEHWYVRMLPAILPLLLWGGLVSYLVYVYLWTLHKKRPAMISDNLAELRIVLSIAQSAEPVPPRQIYDAVRTRSTDLKREPVSRILPVFLGYVSPVIAGMDTTRAFRAFRDFSDFRSASEPDSVTAWFMRQKSPVDFRSFLEHINYAGSRILTSDCPSPVVDLSPIPGFQELNEMESCFSGLCGYGDIIPHAARWAAGNNQPVVFRLTLNAFDYVTVIAEYENRLRNQVLSEASTPFSDAPGSLWACELSPPEFATYASHELVRRYGYQECKLETLSFNAEDTIRFVHSILWFFYQTPWDRKPVAIDMKIRTRNQQPLPVRMQFDPTTALRLEFGVQ